jgi:hypothetical protein
LRTELAARSIGVARWYVDERQTEYSARGRDELAYHGPDIETVDVTASWGKKINDSPRVVAILDAPSMREEE